MNILHMPLSPPLILVFLSTQSTDEWTSCLGIARTGLFMFPDSLLVLVFLGATKLTHIRLVITVGWQMFIQFGL